MPQATTPTPHAIETVRTVANQGDGCDDNNNTPRPNPCVTGTPAEPPCECRKSDGHPEPKPRRPRHARRQDACCEQLIDLVSRVPGINLPVPHKPKQRPARKANDLCRAFSVSDALIPLITVLWSRHETNAKPRNEFEAKVESIFDTIGKVDQKDFSYGLQQYRALREAGKAECPFNDCLAEAAGKGPIEAAWLAEKSCPFCDATASTGQASCRTRGTVPWCGTFMTSTAPMRTIRTLSSWLATRSQTWSLATKRNLAGSSPTLQLPRCRCSAARSGRPAPTCRFRPSTTAICSPSSTGASDQIMPKPSRALRR